MLFEEECAGQPACDVALPCAWNSPEDEVFFSRAGSCKKLVAPDGRELALVGACSARCTGEAERAARDSQNLLALFRVGDEGVREPRPVVNLDEFAVELLGDATQLYALLAVDLGQVRDQDLI